MEICHTPVFLNFLLQEVITKQDRLFLDATLGEGGHSYHFLKRGLKGVGFERDEDILQVASRRLKIFLDSGDFSAFCTNFSDAEKILKDRAFDFDLILFDLGISRYHYFQSGRGFSFQKDEELDMRLCQADSKSAGFVVNKMSEKQLADIFFYYGEIRNARKLASVIVKERAKKNIDTALQLADLILHAAGGKRGKIHPATQVFQALRIYVNDEFGHLERGIKSVIPFLQRGGRLAVISYHSLEDRIVKKTFHQYLKRSENNNKYANFSKLPFSQEKKSLQEKAVSKEQASLQEEVDEQKGMDRDKEIDESASNDASDNIVLLEKQARENFPKEEYFLFSKKVVKPTRDEVISNAAARSAKLRILVKR